MRFIPMKMQKGIDDTAAVLKDGKPIYICPICSKETQDVIEVFYSKCHRDDVYEKLKLKRPN